MKPAKFADGVIAQEFSPEEVIDEDSSVIGFVKMFKNGKIAIMWSPLLFCNPNLPMPDALREILVEKLRFHADKLESREMDEQMKQLAGKIMGDA